MSEIDDIFARLGGGPLASTDQRDRRDIPRRGKAGGSRTVEVVHLAAGRSGVRAAVARGTEPGVRAQTWDGGFPAKSARHPRSLSAEPITAQAPDQVGQAVIRQEPLAEVVLTSSSVRVAVEVQHRPINETAARSGARKQQRERSVADPFNPNDDRANCLRCGYAVESRRDRRGLLTCAACAARG